MTDRPSPIQGPDDLDYFAKALDLVGDRIETITPEEFDAQRQKLLAIIRNTVFILKRANQYRAPGLRAKK